MRRFLVRVFDHLAEQARYQIEAPSYEEAMTEARARFVAEHPDVDVRQYRVQTDRTDSEAE